MDVVLPPPGSGEELEQLLAGKLGAKHLSTNIVQKF